MNTTATKQKAPVANAKRLIGWATIDGQGSFSHATCAGENNLCALPLFEVMDNNEQLSNLSYLDQKRDELGEILMDNATIRVIAPELDEIRGSAATMLDVLVLPGETFSIQTGYDQNALVYLIEGGASISGQEFGAHSAVVLGCGDTVAVKTQKGGHARLVYLSGLAA